MIDYRQKREEFAEWIKTSKHRRTKKKRIIKKLYGHWLGLSLDNLFIHVYGDSIIDLMPVVSMLDILSKKYEEPYYENLVKIPLD